MEQTTEEFAFLPVQDTPLENAENLFDYESITESAFIGQIYNMTPTGEAVAAALDAFYDYPAPGSGGTDKEKFIVLLTDGQNNSGYYDLNIVSGDHGIPNYLNTYFWVQNFNIR